MKAQIKILIVMLILCAALAVIPLYTFAGQAEPAPAEDVQALVITDEAAGEDKADAAIGAADAKEPAQGESESPDSNTDGVKGDNRDYKEDKAEKAENDGAEENKPKEDRQPAADKQVTAGSAGTKVLKAAAAANASVSYTAKRNPTSNDVQFTAKINGTSYTGTCCELGVKFKSSGTAAIAVLGKNHLCRKVAYKYKGWQGEATRNYDMGGVYKGGCLESMMQYAMAWEKDKALGSGVTTNRDKVTAHMKKSSSNGGNGWNASTVNKITDAVKALNKQTADELGIPGKFRVYWGKITNTKSGDTTYGQDALFWGNMVSGTGAVKKVPAAESSEYVAAHPDEFDLAGAQYQLYTDSACKTKAQDVNWANAVLTTKADGTSNVRTLEVGTYYAKETKAPNKGYGLAIDEATGKAKVYIVKITKGNKTTFTSEEPIKIGPEPPSTAELTIYKINSDTEEDLAGAELSLTGSSGELIESWTTGEEAHVISDIADGAYTLCEIKAPYGYETADDVTFRVESGSVIVPGTDTDEEGGIRMQDPPVSVETSAVSAATGISQGARKHEERITDNVTLTGLIPGRTYRIDGMLMSKNGGEAIPGTEVSKSFTATEPSMDVTMDYTFDSAELDDEDSVVVFETLYRTSLMHDETSPVELCRHHDIDDDAQTVIYPRISTEASLQSDNTEVRDVISYRNLMPDMRYVFRGWLADTVTGEKVPDSDGMIELENAEDSGGQVEMILKTGKYDDMSGHSLTAFEELYIVGNESGNDGEEILIAEHKDLNDSAQTVEIYHDLKVRKNVTGNLGDLSKVFGYALEFRGLVPEAAYTIEGDDEKIFMADGDGEASVPLRLKDDQEAVIRSLPKGAVYKVTEEPSDHIAGFRIFSEEMENKGAKITVKKASGGSETSKGLSTAEETVDLLDGTIVVLWENNRDLATLTGIGGPDIKAYVAALAAIAFAAAVIIIRRIKGASE